MTIEGRVEVRTIGQRRIRQMGNLANGQIVKRFTRITGVGVDQVTQPRGRGVGFSHPVIVRDDRKLKGMQVSKEEIVVFRYMWIPQDRKSKRLNSSHLPLSRML